MLTATADTMIHRPVVRESIVNNDPKFFPTFDVPDAVYQGDLLIACISKLPDTAKRRTGEGSQQLAEGNTQGARHILRNGIAVYECDPQQVSDMISKGRPGVVISPQYTGLVFVSPTDATENDLMHPEHGNHGYRPGAICAVAYQRSLDAEEREQRVRD